MIVDDLFENTAGPEKCWPGYRKVGTKPGTGGNKGKRVNDCEKINEAEGEFGIGDPVIITGDVEFQGKTGDVREIGRDGAFVVVNLYNYGPHSFHTSDVSRNDYADEEDAEDVAEGPEERSQHRLWQMITDYEQRAKRAPNDIKKQRYLQMAKELRGPVKEQGVAEGSSGEELANEVYAEFERMYPNLARRADERTVHAAIMDVLNYGGDSDPGALAQDVAKAVKRDMQGVAEATGDEKFDKMLKGVTSKKAVAKQQKTDTKQQARDAFGGMFGGGNPADKLGIRPKGVAESNTDRIADRYDPEEFDQMVLRLKTLAGAGPLKTVWDPQKRVYKNVPINPPQDQK